MRTLRLGLLAASLTCALGIGMHASAQTATAVVPAATRPIFHSSESRIEAHIFVAFLAYCLQVTLKANLKPLAGGITPREVITKFKTMQMVDVCIPTTDGRELLMSRHTQPEPDHRILLEQLRLKLPEQPPPKITAREVHCAAAAATTAL